MQLGAIISQAGIPITYYLCKLTSCQQLYTTIEKEFFFVIETLKEFLTILQGQRINDFTDHKNLTCANFNTDHVYHWWLLLEEYGPMLCYIPGNKNEAANALS